MAPVADTLGYWFDRSDPQVCPGLHDAQDRVAQVVVLRQRRANQVLQLVVLENLEPFEICERSALSGGSGSGARKVAGVATAGRL